jgi:hypothetical protein
MRLLSRPYIFNGKEMFYSVGQPIGAYSSFAMLALTNHVIVQVSIKISDVQYIKGTGQYAVLGDDVAVSHRGTAETYIRLMTFLGVEVNPVKGFSGRLIEFAKI